MTYPTPKEIMAKPVSHRKPVVKFMKEWKEKFKDKGYRTTPAICDLIFGLAKFYEKVPSVKFSQERSYYQNNCIHLKDFSVITALHEFGHHILGSNERKVCRWSIWLFYKTFPEEFSKLKFKGHMLIRDKTIKTNPSCQLLERQEKSQLLPANQALPEFPAIDVSAIFPVHRQNT